MCVSYRGFNKVTNMYEYSIPCYDTTITIFQIGSATMYIIMADKKQCYHQITVRDKDINKLAFFGPDKKNTVTQ